VGDFDVSVVCKRFGGGGHKNASGFELPVDKFNGQLVLSGKVPTIAALGGI
jgi:nanoRNase/pAp phosphatase (c-di-AMP/oligoRNAs hydrolase)